MRKYLSLIILSLLFLASCEKDDFCINPVTPKLVIRFYDAGNPQETKTVSNLTVWASGFDTIYNNVSTDSIAIPLDVASTDIIYNFSQGGTHDQIAFFYEVEEEFVSRSCGFRAIFNNITTIDSFTWIDSTSPNTITSITDETEAHLKIYH